MAKVKVSILCITYNQAGYIRQTMDGFLMQKTSFDYEILINDDHSTDGTVEIIREYAREHNNIKLNLQKENLYSKGIRGMFMRFLLPQAKGEYLALCEGDDYWTDPHKIQEQADFLDKHPDYAICFHPVKVIFENSREKGHIFPETDDSAQFSVKELLKRNYIQTDSVMYRKQDYNNLSFEVFPADWFLHLYHAQFGKIGFIDKVMAVYRRHPNGIWWGTNKNSGDTDGIWKKHGLSRIALYDALLNIYGRNPEYRKIIDGHIGEMLNALNRVDKKYKTDLLKQSIQEFPQAIKSFLIYQHQDKQETELNHKKEINELTAKLRRAQTELDTIINSRAFKAARVMQKTSARLRPRSKKL